MTNTHLAVAQPLSLLLNEDRKQLDCPIQRIDFCVVGVQKAGTTALHHFLSQHPSIRMSYQKEVHFFDAEHHFSGNEPDYEVYHRAFPGSGDGTIVGECTPIYIFWPNALERIAAYNPGIRLIAIFRDPINRAYSQWRMTRDRGRDDLPFSVAIREGRERLLKPTDFGLRNWTYVERGFYGDQVRKVRSLFPANQLLFLCTEDLRDRHAETLRVIFRFLGLPPVEIQQDFIFCSPEVTHRGLMSGDDIAYLEQIFREDMVNFAALTHLGTSRWS